MTASHGETKGANSCGGCGAVNPPSAKFCNSCGKQMAAPKPQPDGEDPLIGALVGNRFLVEKKIGEGGMGMVYRGIQKGISRPVALKVLRTSFVRDPNLIERFRNEAATASRLTHPNTVTIYDFGEIDDGALYIAMEYVEGSDLAGELAHSHMSWERACKITSQICESLDEAHSLGIVHRDLKPDNVMLGSRGRETDIVKVLDFGIAKIMARENQKQLTAAGEVFGTPEFMSPEQIRGDKLGPWSDIYSLGVILYLMLCGKLPFDADQPMALLVKHLTEQAPPLDEVLPEGVSIPSELSFLVMASIGKTPDERPASMKEFADIIERIVNAQPPVVVRRQTPPAIQSPPIQSPRVAPTPEKGFSSTKIVHPESLPVEPAAPLSSEKEDLATSKTILAQSLPAQAPASKPAEPSPPSAEKKEPRVQAEAAAKKEEAQESPLKKPVSRKSPQDESPDEIEDHSEDDIIEALIKKMKRKRDFPAVSKHISELNTKVARKNTSARQLSNVILKDYSLTSKLLRLINSPYYGQVRGRITTVSRAVVLMGFESVRQAALGLLMFDHFAVQAGSDADDLRESVLESLLSGIIAKGVAENSAAVNKEEAFVCAMFRNLGQNLVAFYFPVKYRKIKKLQEQGMSEQDASMKIIGTTFEALAKALGKRWDLPDEILGSMSAMPEGDLGTPADKATRLRNLAGMATELAEVASSGDPSGREEDLARIFKRYEKTVKLSDKHTASLFDNTLKEIEDYSQALSLGVKNSTLVQKVAVWNGEKMSTVPDFAASAKERKSVVPLESLSPQQRAKEDRVAREKIMISGVDEVAAAVSRHDDLNSVMMMVLETMYRGLNLSRVLFCLNDVSSGNMRARSGFGDDVDDFIRRFQFRLSRGQDVFHTALGKGRDMVVDLERTPAYESKLPAWYKRATEALPSTLLIYPILISGFPAGLFYGDISSKDRNVDRKILVHMNKLRTNAAKAIKRTLPRGGRSGR